MSNRNRIAILLIVVSFVVLIPGLTRPLITISATMPLLGEIFNQTRSIIGSIRDLHDSGNDFVAGLILLFSVVVPFVKGALLALALTWRGTETRLKLYDFVSSISKWAMADVFAVGVYIAFLAAKATDNLDAKLHDGFYYFVAYCIISLLSVQLLKIEPRG